MTDASSYEYEIELAKNVTIAEYRQYEADENRDAIATFIQKRFTERYIRPLRGDRDIKHGFCTMAICCLMIETLDSFYEGLGDTSGRGNTKKAFLDFFIISKHPHNEPLAAFEAVSDDFYGNVRNGILHQAETKGGWRILRKGPLFDPSSRTINATKFHAALEQCLINYCERLRETEWDDDLWKNLRKKMETICKNCAPPR